MAELLDSRSIGVYILDFFMMGPKTAEFLWKIRDESGFGVCGVREVFFIVNFNETVAQKLRRIILLHFGLVTLRFHFGKIWNPSHLHDFLILGRVHDSQNQIDFK